MAREFYSIENYKNHGKIGISHQVFEEISNYVIKEIDGVESLDSPSRKHNTVCKLVRDQVYLTISIRVRYGINVNEIVNKIHNRVSQTILNMTEIMPAKIEVNIADVR